MVLKAIADPTGFVDEGALELAQLAPADLLARWDAGRTALGVALRELPDGQKMPWFGPPMSPTSMATARFMETWAHALDVYDALGERPATTDRIKQVAHLGVRTRNYSFVQQRLEPPADGVPGRAEGTEWRAVGLGAGGRGAVGDRLGVRLLPAGHPAHPP